MAGPETSSTSVIRQVGLAELGCATDLLATAFLRGDLGPYLVSDIRERATVYHKYFRILAAYWLTHGHVDMIGHGLAGAFWYRVGGRFELSIPAYASRLARITGIYCGRFVHLDKAMEAHHPTGRAHHYLGFLAVRPGQQGQGLGSRLLEHHHRFLDTAGIPAYLEATGDRNSKLYARHGYTPLTPYPAGPAGPLLYPMWRDPQK